MIDVFNIPSNQQTTFTFYSIGTGTTNNWQTWNKPRNAKFIQIFCVGGGAGGGRITNNTGSPTGAGGGGSSGLVRGIIPAFLLPDTLYILVGKGGLGGRTSPGQGGAGGISYVSIDGTTNEQTLICKSSTAAPTGGPTGGGGGAGGTLSTVSLSAFGNLGLFTAIAGVGGGAGGANTPVSGTSVTSLSTTLLTGGAGGGAKNSTLSSFAQGGNVNAAPVILTNQVNGGVSSGQNGDSGYGIMKPFCGTGGAGGAGSLTTAGNGGNGWYGCGGGGGGGGTTSGNGGDGGDGIVIITVIS